MDFRLTEEQLMVQQLTKDFREKELEPIAAEIDRTGRFPHDLRKKLGTVLRRWYGQRISVKQARAKININIYISKKNV